jgi:hypothetical protein
MSLDKAIESGKEKRKPYYKSGKFDTSCRAGGSCPYCKRNRFHKTIIKILTANEDMEEFSKGI